jgi:hypothetical protein
MRQSANTNEYVDKVYPFSRRKETIAAPIPR